MNWLIRERKLHFYQTAYRAHHITMDQLFYLCRSIIGGLQKKSHEETVAVFLDLSSAFDRVWLHKLVHIAHEVGIEGHALVWINDFLRNRHFSVRFNGELSKTRRTYAGVPQGSVLSPLLFLLYMNIIDAYIHKSTKIACYAYNIAIWTTNYDLKTSQKFLNLCLKGIVTWAKDLKLTINPNKSNYCVFSTDRKNHRTFQPVLKIQNTIIGRVENPKYLGAILDPELRFTKRMKTTANKDVKSNSPRVSDPKPNDKQTANHPSEGDIFQGEETQCNKLTAPQRPVSSITSLNNSKFVSLLLTAKVLLDNSEGDSFLFRALLDSVSESSFESAYACVIYAVQRTNNGVIEVTTLAAKSKVAPLKPVSIPRLKLNGVPLTFEILDLIPQSIWKYVPSKENPEVCILRICQTVAYDGRALLPYHHQRLIGQSNQYSKTLTLSLKKAKKLHVYLLQF
ncbi:putative RNA-directed DNA polymerase like protein [Argiope bruennichi]|uniref:Putative RNA-directed DNA polymerase like protein n=1 Tax=Argiope bruennichi TaxID=94029 RepID=A0A8T0FL24_ARGBR|nr:putative RNA-directed DNA polymerase like protein [Argiope bruennichi]